MRVAILALSFVLLSSLSFAQDFVSEQMLVKFDYTLSVDGEVVETSEGKQPLEYVHGEGKIIPGLAKELTGLKVGDSKVVEVAPADAYGEVLPNAIINMPKDQFPEEFTPEVGLVIEMKNEQGQILPAVIKEIQEEEVTLDFNHPLAGKTLKFDVTIVSVEDAKAEAETATN